MAFADNLQQLPAADSLSAVQLKNAAGDVVATIENKPGQAGSLRVYAALADKHGEINQAAAAEGMEIYAEHTADAISNPGKHPNIDRLIAIRDGGAALHLSKISA
jgi:hypothetical protein